MMVYDLFKPFVIVFLQQVFNDYTTFHFISKIEKTLNLQFHEISKYMAFIVTVTMYYSVRMKENDENSLLFPGISRVDADQSVIKLIKFLFNYGFYKFGIEVILMTMLTLICTKIDLLSILYLPMIITLAFKKRQALKTTCKLASIYIMFVILIQLAVLIIYQLFEFDEIFSQGKSVIFSIIAYLEKSPLKMTYDYILLIMFTCQIAVSECYKDDDFLQDPFKFGGENDSTIPPKKYGLKNIYKHSIYLFPEKIDNFMDLFKRYIFKIQYWMTISVIFLAGTKKIDIFSLCYITCSFVFLWQGTEFYLKSLNVLLHQWNLLLAYNITAISLKVIIKILGCASGKKIPKDYCFLLSIFDVPCASDSRSIEDSIFCHDLNQRNALFWDMLAFAFIIIQRRIFQSYYFYNIKQDTRITNIMASRGAKLTEMLRIQEMNKRKNEEMTYLENLRLRMEKIRTIVTLQTQERNNNMNHDLAVRSGDILMFNDDFDDDQFSPLQEISKKSTSLIKSKCEECEDGFFDIELTSEKSKEKAETVVVSGNMKKLFINFFQNLFKKLHARSKNHTYIIKLLSQEKKYLKNTLSPPSCEETA